MKTAKALSLDIFLWSYTCIVIYKIVYQKLWLGARFESFSWNGPLLACLVGTLAALICFFSPGKFPLSLGRAFNSLYAFKEHEPWAKKPFALWGYFVVGLTFLAGIVVAQVSLREFFSPQGLAGARRIFGALLNPNFGIVEDALFAAIETIYMAFIATSVALPFAFVLSFFAARNLMSGGFCSRLIYNLCRFFLNTTRSIEPLVWAIIFSVWVGIGPFAGTLALCLHSISSLAKLYSEQIESIGDGPIEAMTSTGAHPVQVVWFGVVPQIILPYLSFTIYRWDINVRMATVIGLVGGGGIGTMLMQYQGLAKWNEVGLLAITIALIVWLMDYTSSKIRAAIK